MELSAILESLFRWIHIVAGIVWIGHLYFFNFVNAPLGGALDGANPFGLGVILMILVTFLAAALYDVLAKSALGTNLIVLAGVGWFLVGFIIVPLYLWAGFGYRGYVIHTGTLFGTIMAYNVWMRIWPAQKKIIAAVKGGTPPDPA